MEIRCLNYRFNVINDISQHAIVSSKKSQETAAIANIPPVSSAKRQTPSRQTFNYSSSSTAPNHLSCCPLAWGNVGVSGLPVSSNPLTPGRSQMSRVLYKVLCKSDVLHLAALA